MPEEVERLIPVLARVMERLMPAHREALDIRAALHAEQRRITLAGGGVLDRTTWQARAARLERLTADIQAGLQEIAALGGTTKDLATGLVDFPHRRGGRTVNLCWRYGEERITHWHGLDEGYAGRKPL